MTKNHKDDKEGDHGAGCGCTPTLFVNMMENAMLMVLRKFPMPTPEQGMAILKKGLEHYARAGITTAQDCATGKGTWQLLAAMAEAGQLPIDVVAWPAYKGGDDAAFDAIASWKNKSGPLKQGGIKIILDGSIQGYTGYLSQPYHVQPGGSQIVADHCDSEEAESLFIGPENQTGASALFAQSADHDAV